MLRLDERRLLGALDDLAAVGAIEGGGCARLALTDEDKVGRDLVVGWMKALGLAVMTELPLVIVNSQRGGPSTGLPTKTEQADLLQAVYGRNGECPVPVIAAV